MKQLIVFSLACVALAFSMSLPRVQRSPPKDLPIERLVLDQISLLVVLHNSTGLPEFGNGKKIMLPKLTSCITEPQRDAIKTCSKDITPKFPMPPGDHRKPGEDGFVPQFISPSDLSKVVECILNDTASIEKDGSAINEENLKESFIGHSDLTATQKTLAADSLSACLKLDLPISKPNEMVMTLRLKNVFKAGFCSFKAMIENGCAERDNSGKLIYHQMARAFESDSSDSVEELVESTSDEIMSQIKRGRNRCTGNTAHHTCNTQGNTNASNAGATASSGAAATGGTASSGTASAAAAPSAPAAPRPPATSG